LAGIGNLPYTDVIVAFLVPDDNLNLHGSGGAFNDNLQSSIQTLQNAGKNVLISLGGGARAAAKLGDHGDELPLSCGTGVPPGFLVDLRAWRVPVSRM
jgi:hypothetical protein